jgi:hypothetical protein
MRENKRYILLAGKKEDAERAILEFIGVLGYAKAGICWPAVNILAVNREEVDKVRGALVLAGIPIKRVSGTIRGVKTNNKGN